MQFFRGEKNWN
jgi:hypothetical protein